MLQCLLVQCLFAQKLTGRILTLLAPCVVLCAQVHPQDGRAFRGLRRNVEREHVEMFWLCVCRGEEGSTKPFEVPLLCPLVV